MVELVWDGLPDDLRKMDFLNECSTLRHDSAASWLNSVSNCEYDRMIFATNQFIWIGSCFLIDFQLGVRVNYFFKFSEDTAFVLYILFEKKLSTDKDTEAVSFFIEYWNYPKLIILD